MALKAAVGVEEVVEEEIVADLPVAGIAGPQKTIYETTTSSLASFQKRMQRCINLLRRETTESLSREGR